MDTKKLTQYCYDSTTTTEWLEHLSETHLSDKRLNFRKVKNAWIVPDRGLLCAFSGGGYTEKGEPILESFQRDGLRTAHELIAKTDLSKIKKIDTEVVYLGQYRNHWGNFLVDSIARLWFALDDPEKHTYAFLATQARWSPIHENAYRFLELLGIKREQILYITDPMQIETLIIPELSYTPLKEWHREYLEIISKVVKNASCNISETYEKVYFSRSKFSRKSHTDFGEEMLVELMRANGFHIIYPEEHTLEEQIYYVNNCKVFASVGGSCAHNIIFSHTRPKVILFNRMNGYQWHQWMMDEMAGVEPITYVDAYCEPYKFFFETTISGPYLYWINKNVQRFATDNGMILPKIGLIKKLQVGLRYTWWCFRTMLYKWKKRLLKHLCR